MKAFYTFIILLIPFIFSCNSSSSIDDLTAQIEQSIINKTWKLNNVDTVWFKLNYDNTYSTKEYYCDSLENFGTWELNGNILTKEYEDEFSLNSIQLIVLDYNDTTLALKEVNNQLSSDSIFYEISNVTWGCLDSLSLNFNPDADCNSECEYTYGCTDFEAINFNPTASTDDGSCCFISGCTNDEAYNYNPDACIDDDSCNFLSELAIGDIYMGGIIFWLDGNGGGLIAATSDQTNLNGVKCFGNCNSSIYYNFGFVELIGSGADNTHGLDLICSESGTAVDICTNLILNGYDDWYLPSIMELKEMYFNIGGGIAENYPEYNPNAEEINLGNIGGFENAYYWSSTVTDSYKWIVINNYTQLYAIAFHENAPALNSLIDFYPRYSHFRVRAIRSF